MLSLLLALLPGVAALSPLDPTDVRGIEWETEVESALNRASEEQRIVFVAAWIDDEGRSARFAKDVYPNREIAKLAEETVNLIASPGRHKKSGECRHFSDITCLEHQRVHAELVERDVLRANSEGAVCAPQHLWLSPAGEVLLCVPFEMTADEVAWCFAFARWKLNEEAPFHANDGARAPRRLVFGRGSMTAPGTSGRGLTETELAEELKTLKSAFWNDGRIASWLKVVFTDDDQAAGYIRTELGTGALTWNGVERLNGALDVMGEWAPAVFAPVLTDFIKHEDPSVRLRVAIGLEQHGLPETAKTIRKALKKEKDPAVRRAWLRALGAAGYDDRAARKALMDVVSKEESGSDRRCAILALGWSAREEAVGAVLVELLQAESEEDSRVAGCALALSRDPSWIGLLEQRAAQLPDGPGKQGLLRCAEVLRGASLAQIRGEIESLCETPENRGRLYFQSL